MELRAPRFEPGITKIKWPCFVLLLMLLAACGDNSNEPNATSSTPQPSPTSAPALKSTPTPTSTPAPTFEKSDCLFVPPLDQKVECGFVTVPEDRTAAGSASIRLHVAVFKSTSLDAASDPVVYLEGGPGAKALELARLSFAPYYSPFLNNRDFIMFDQRGVGFSEPALYCPEYVAFSYDILDEGLSVNEATYGSV